MNPDWDGRMKQQAREPKPQAGAPRVVAVRTDETIVAHECHGTMRPYPPELCGVCMPSEPVGVMTLRELVAAFNHLRETVA